MEVPACEECGCKGNESCGHSALDREWGCALYPDLRCPCCHIKEKKHNKPLEFDSKYMRLLLGMLFKPFNNMSKYRGS